jgi:type IV secretion system protein VirD4
VLSTRLFRGLKWGHPRVADLIGAAVCGVIGLVLYLYYSNFWIAGGVSGFLFVFYMCRHFDAPEPTPAPEEVITVSEKFGSASYAGEQTTLDDPDAPFKGVFFGRSNHPDRTSSMGVPICSRPETHSIIIAKTRAGKGVRILVPTLLRYGLGRGKGGAASVFCIDPKGENAAITANARRAFGSQVYIINPWNELGDTYGRLGFGPASYNPLDLLKPDDPNVVSIAQSFAASMSPSTGQKEAFWASSASNIIAAVMLWLTAHREEQKTLGRVADILGRSKKSFQADYVTQMVRCPDFGGAVRRLAGPFLDMPDVTYGGVMSHIAQAIAFLTDPQIIAATNVSTFSMADLTGAGKDRPTTVYLVVPWDKVDVQKTWLRLMITAGMHTFKHKPKGSKYRCLFLIDEFPALGMIENISRDIATMSGAGVDFLLAVQSLADLKDVYGEGQARILGNCAYKWFCNVNDLTSAEFLSKTLGKKTIRIENTGENKGESYSGGQHGHRSKSEGESKSYSETGRELLTPDEVQNLGREAAILLTPNSRPHYLRPIDYWHLQEAFVHLRERYPDLYWPLYFDRNAALDPSMPQVAPQPPEREGLRPAGKPAGKSAYDPTVYAKTTPGPSRTAPAKEQDKPPSPTVDLDYYSPQRIAERAAAKKPPR